MKSTWMGWTGQDMSWMESGDSLEGENHQTLHSTQPSRAPQCSASASRGKMINKQSISLEYQYDNIKRYISPCTGIYPSTKICRDCHFDYECTAANTRIREASAPCLPTSLHLCVFFSRHVMIVGLHCSWQHCNTQWSHIFVCNETSFRGPSTRVS